MTPDVDKLVSEVDQGLASLASGNRTIALRMAEFLFDLDHKLTELLKLHVPLDEHKKALAKVASLERRCGSLEQDLQNAVAGGEAWERACLKMHRQVLDLVGTQSETNDTVLARLSDARSILPDAGVAGVAEAQDCGADPEDEDENAPAAKDIDTGALDAEDPDAKETSPDLNRA